MLDPKLRDAISTFPSDIEYKVPENEKHNTHAQIEPSDSVDLFISWVNENQDKLGWKADQCKLQKNHPDYPAKCKQLSERGVGDLYRNESDEIVNKFSDGSDDFKKAL